MPCRLRENYAGRAFSMSGNRQVCCRSFPLSLMHSPHTVSLTTGKEVIVYGILSLIEADIDS